jgi:hypothetical protein
MNTDFNKLVRLYESNYENPDNNVGLESAPKYVYGPEDVRDIWGGKTDVYDEDGEAEASNESYGELSFSRKYVWYGNSNFGTDHDGMWVPYWGRLVKACKPLGASRFDSKGGNMRFPNENLPEVAEAIASVINEISGFGESLKSNYPKRKKVNESFYVNDFTTDNRDTSETEIQFEVNGELCIVRVDPWELLENLIENSGHPATDSLLSTLEKIKLKVNT